ncbi:MAG: alanine racemase [Alphaproteobacteria bacterium]|nr:alanine racemase [Alphaproteobacteria bacterium]
MNQIRPTTATIDLTRVGANLRAVRGQLGSGIAVMAAVKGDAYGHGAVPVARGLESAGVDWFGVALVEEGRALRDAGVRTPILCLEGVAREGAEAAIELGLTPMLFDLESAARLDAAARAAGRPVAVHLKVDTGMGRLGVPYGEFEAFLDKLANFMWIRVEGMATHFAESESDPTFTREQGRRFRVAVAAARARSWEPTLLHASNSAAALGLPDLRFNLIRPGLALYGLPPRPDLNPGLRPAMRVTTRVLYVKNIPAGYGVSYGRRWIAERPTRLATLPVGYADGYPRALSNRADVLIHGQRCPVRGAVCMDLVMVDVTDVVPAVRVDDEVELLGEGIPADELAERAGTISYEIVTGFSQRIPRRYAALDAHPPSEAHAWSS